MKEEGRREELDRRGSRLKPQFPRSTWALVFNNLRFLCKGKGWQWDWSGRVELLAPESRHDVLEVDDFERVKRRGEKAHVSRFDQQFVKTSGYMNVFSGQRDSTKGNDKWGKGRKAGKKT